MALRLRRGTDAERQLITPAEGELVYTTDTENLFIGNGATQGGVIVTGANGAFQLTDLNDVTFANPSDGDVLHYDANLATWVSDAVTLLSLSDVDDAAPSDGNVLVYDTTTSTWISTTTDELLELTNLSDVDLTGGVANGDILSYNNTSGTWQAITAPIEGATVLDELTDVNAASPVNNQILKYDATFNNAWVLADLTLESLTDVDTTGKSVGDVLTWNGTEYAALPPASAGSTFDGDVTGSIFGDDSSLFFDAINGTMTVDSGIVTNLLTDTIKSDTLDAPVFIGDAGIVVDNNTTGDTIAAFSIVENDNWLTFNSSRVSITEPEIVQAGDLLSGLIFNSYDGAIYQRTSVITSEVDALGTIGAGAVSGKIRLINTNAVGDGIIEAQFNTRGTFTAPVIQPGTYADAAARDAFITSPVAGMMVFLTDGDGVGTPKFQGYNGTAWIDLN